MAFLFELAAEELGGYALEKLLESKMSRYILGTSGVKAIEKLFGIDAKEIVKKAGATAIGNIGESVGQEVEKKLKEKTPEEYLDIAVDFAKAAAYAGKKQSSSMPLMPRKPDKSEELIYYPQITEQARRMLQTKSNEKQTMSLSPLIAHQSLEHEMQRRQILSPSKRFNPIGLRNFLPDPDDIIHPTFQHTHTEPYRIMPPDPVDRTKPKSQPRSIKRANPQFGTSDGFPEVEKKTNKGKKKNIKNIVAI